jgi:hypothetical protein
MQLKPQLTEVGSSIYLTASIMLASIDYSSVVEYAIKALIGGVIWVGVKISGEMVIEKLKRRKK